MEKEVCKNIDYDSIFESNIGLVHKFLNEHYISFLEREDYTQMLYDKFWELINKFDWNLEINPEKQRISFCGYIKTGLTHFYTELKEQNSKIKKYKDENQLSLNCITNDGDETCFIDLVKDEKYNEDYFNKNYSLYTLKNLKNENIIKGYLIDYIELGSYSKVAKKWNCSRGKAKSEIDIELDELRKRV